MTGIRHPRPLAAVGLVAFSSALVLLAVSARAARPPPTVSIINPGPGTVATPAPVSPREGTGDFKVQVQVWNAVEDAQAITRVSVRHCPTTGTCPAISQDGVPDDWSSSDAARNDNYQCGAGCGVYDVNLSGLTDGGSYFLQAEAVADGNPGVPGDEEIGRSSDGRQGNARYVVIRVLAAGTGTGTLVVRDSSSQLCVDCHALRSHGSATLGAHYGNWEVVCLECHTPHGTTNVYLVKQNIRTPSGEQKDVRLYGQAGDATNSYVDSAAGANTAGVCQVCHTRTRSRTKGPRWRASGGSDPNHYAAAGPGGTARCTSCHTHDGGFSHGHGNPCNTCHGHDTGWGGNPDLGRGTFQSHSTHTENDADDRRGPALACDACHEVPNYPFLRSGTDADGDGWIDLGETDVCDGCHSAGGAYDGVNDAAIGAKASWRSGVYSGNAIGAGKERWCVGCHDGGTSVIGGRQAPNIGGDGLTYGYYVAGHGAQATECTACHDHAASHNFDGEKTYRGARNNYQVASASRA